jgi:dTDP-glucose 4,6-dehydratase
MLQDRSDLRAAFAASPAATGGRAIDLITHVSDRPGHDRRYAIDYRKAARELGYAPTRDLRTGLRDTLEWYLRNRGWWEPLLGRDYAAWINMNYGRR